MKILKFLVVLLVVFFSQKNQAQCNEVVTVSICDMTTIDNDNNGTPDGIINLYDEYNAAAGVQAPISTLTGAWFDPNYNFALNEITGDLYLWDLNNTSEAITDYQFTLIDESSSCLEGVLVTFNLILGPFSGYGRPVLSLDDVNLEVCDLSPRQGPGCDIEADVDLFAALESIPSPHLNGLWVYEGNSPNFVSLIGSELTVTIPYVSGPPLVDQETFELTYIISGISPCDTTEETTVNVSITRPVFSGYAQATRICELDLLNGIYDADVDLTDDRFLVQEDLEGVWGIDDYGQIDGPADSKVNFKSIYDQIILNEGLRFGCAEVEFNYSVQQRSAVCGDDNSTIMFKIYEYLRPFKEIGGLEYCEKDPILPSTIDLYDYLEFTTEQGVLFEYQSDEYGETDWRLVSGPSSLSLISNSQLHNDYSYRGTISLEGAVPGEYVFEYVVSPEINCPSDSFFAYTQDSCLPVASDLGFCNSERAQVTLTINPYLYAGEDTSGLEFCENDPTIEAPLDLFSLLTTNGVDAIYQGPEGVWTDKITRAVVTSPTAYVLPEINNEQVFSFLYATRTSNGCIDEADLSFTIYESFNPGIGSQVNVCNTESPFNLFDNLVGSPNDNGTWVGPNGYATSGNTALLDPNTLEAGVYTYTVPDNVNIVGDVVCTGSESIVTINLFQSPNAGTDDAFTVCRMDSQIDLLDYLDPAADSGGVFQDIDGTSVLTGSSVDVSQLASGDYRFQYEVLGNASCGLATSILLITVEEVDEPQIENQIFCVIDGAKIEDLVVNNGLDFVWYDSNTASASLPVGALLVDGEDYFVAALYNGCESPRVSTTVTLLPLSHTDCETCIKDGISVNGDNLNDVLDLCNFPEIFPDFEINIFNRYGTKVYTGTKNTPLFRGVSNAPLTIGDELPSGVYFYVFDPKDGETKPFQSNFYLSR